MPREMRFRRTAECARSREAAAAASVILPRTAISLSVQSVRSFFGRFWVKDGILSLQRFQKTEALLIPVLRATSPSGIFPRRAISLFRPVVPGFGIAGVASDAEGDPLFMNGEDAHAVDSGDFAVGNLA